METHEIALFIKNDFHSSKTAGYITSAIDLYVESADVEKATAIVDDLIRDMELKKNISYNVQSH
ncbi:hypothetical protein ACE1ET_04885 [Saccharicrinis sp. FJH62]|uniref:hypothetical protein n=1 Tax=Saccharicrinis sp. FJH62 TaxID=3344657 RepID=UPI0035D508DA